KREHLNGRIVDLRQCRDRQLGVTNNADQQDCSHQQRGGYRPQNKRARWTHGALLPGVAAAAGVAEGLVEAGFEMVTAVLSCNLSKLLLSKTDRAFTVPVVVSIWLSTVNSVPLAIFFCAARSKASTVSFAFLCSCATTGPKLSSGIVKITVMGSNCVMTTTVALPADCSTLPGSTSRRPTRPAIGAVMWQYST